jgi:hypothetical protein
MEKSMEFPQNLKIDLPYDPAKPLLGIYPKEGDIYTPMFNTTLLTVASLKSSRTGIFTP